MVVDSAVQEGVCRKAWVVAVAVTLLLAGGPGLAAELKSYPSRYYLIQSDLPDANAIREASARMTAMAEEYHRRTRDYSGTIQKRFDFFLFSKEKDYHDAGGPLGSAGVYNAGKEALMAMADHGVSPQLWHVVQHEGFHQFAHLVIGGSMPTWLNEGMAEYFGEGIWTGDGYVVGVVPPPRLKRVQDAIRQQRIVPFVEMITMTAREWTGTVRESYKAPVGGSQGKPTDKPRPGKAGDVTPDAGKGDQATTNYDQAWAMVHFLVHADSGRSREALSNFITDVSRRRDWKQAFLDRFGSNVKSFEKRYCDWWLAQKPDASEELYIRTIVQTLTSYLARATIQGQTFANAEEFLTLARAGKLKCDPDQWLPPSLLAEVLRASRKWKDCWSIEVVGHYPRLILTWSKDKVYIGTFSAPGGKPTNVKVDIQKKA